MTDGTDTTSEFGAFGADSHEPEMNPAEELSAVLRVAELRRLFWRTLLSHSPFRAAICELASEVLSPGSLPREALTRASESREGEALADLLGRADGHGAVSDRILADLASIELGLTSQLCMKLQAPRTGPAFFHYVTAVRRDFHALVVARQVLLRANQRLVMASARRHMDGAMSLRDLVEAGNVGLRKAIDRFDARKGLRFSTYAAWWIRRAITRALAERCQRPTRDQVRCELQ